MSQPSRARRTVAGAAVTALAFSGVVGLSAAPAGALPTFDLERIAGQAPNADRYGTSAEVALEAFPDGADTVIIARGDVFADALAGSYLTPLGPVLLTEPGSLPQVTQDAIDTLEASNAIVLGGTAAVSADVVSQLEDLDLDVTRISGPTREATAAAIATSAGEAGENADGEATAIVVRSDNFADALAFGPLAAAAGYPVLLTNTNTLSAETAEALDDLEIESVIIGGGTAAVSPDVEDAIEDIVGDGDVERVSGATRYETAAQAAVLTTLTVEEFDGDSVIVARGDNAGGGADALSGVALALQSTSPIVLTPPSSTADATLAAHVLLSASLVDGFVLGGTAAIAPAVVDAYQDAGQTTLVTANPVGDVRGGEDATFAVVIDPEAATEIDGIQTITVSGDAVDGDEDLVLTDDDFEVDTESGLITVDVPVDVDASGMSTFTFAVAFADDSDGEAPVLSVDAMVDVAEAQQGELDTRPELVGVTVEDQDDSDGDDLTVTYTFDQSVEDDDGDGDDDLDSDDFLLRGVDPDDSDSADSASISDDGLSVVADFDDVTLDSEAYALVVVEEDAVFAADDDDADDDSDQGNPIGTFAFPNDDQPTGEAGITVAPDLISFGNARSNPLDPSQTLVDIMFDEEVDGFDDVLTNYVLVDDTGTGDGAEFPVDVVDVTEDDDTLTLVFDARDDGTTVLQGLTDGDFPRFYVRTGEVEDGAGNENPLQSVDIADGGNTDSPDLVSASFQFAEETDDPFTTVDEEADRVVYSFDETVSVVNEEAFQVYDVTGGTTAAADGAVTIANGSDVTVEFPAGTLADAVGANIEVLGPLATDRAVVGSDGDGTDTTDANVRDEVGVANDGAGLSTTQGPDLVSVTTSRDGAGATSVTFTFDEPLTDTALTTDIDEDQFALYLADGTRLVPADTDAGVIDGSSVTYSGGFTVSGGDDDGDASDDAEVFGAVLATADDSAVSADGDINPEAAVLVTQGDDESPVQGSADVEQPQVSNAVVTVVEDDVTVVLSFDEPVQDNGAIITDVQLVDVLTGQLDASTVAFDPTNDTLTATFADVEDLGDYTLLTVQGDPVVEDGGGDAVLPFETAFDGGDDADRTGNPGRTVAPDLVGVGNARVNPDNLNETLVDFVFDEDVAQIDRDGDDDDTDADGLDSTTDSEDLAGFVLVRDEGDAGVTPVRAFVTDDDDDVVTAVFDRTDDAEGGPTTTVDALFDQGEFPRAYVRPDTVEDDEGNGVALEGFDIVGNGTTGTPDLTGATIVRGGETDNLTTEIDETLDRIVYTFDEGIVAEVVNEDLFQAFGLDADVEQANEAVVTGGNQVTASFDTGALDDAVVAAIEVESPGVGAVTESDDTGADQDDSVRDAIGLDNDNTDVGAGFTVAPDLVSVEVNDDGSASFTFDQEVGDSSSSDFILYLEDGRAFFGTVSEPVTGQERSTVVEVSGFTTDAIDPAAFATNAEVAAASYATVDSNAVTSSDDLATAEDVTTSPLGVTAVDGADD